MSEQIKKLAKEIAVEVKKLTEGRKKLSELRDKENLVFCNGGDRTNGTNTPEHKLCEELGIDTIYGLGDKIQSSSWLTNKKNDD